MVLPQRSKKFAAPSLVAGRRIAAQLSMKCGARCLSNGIVRTFSFCLLRIYRFYTRALHTKLALLGTDSMHCTLQAAVCEVGTRDPAALRFPFIQDDAVRVVHAADAAFHGLLDWQGEGLL